MPPQNCDFNSYIYILYYQSNFYFYSTPYSAGFLLAIKSNLMEELGQPRGENPALNIMAIRDRRHANVSKQRTLLVDVDVAPPQGAA